MSTMFRVAVKVIFWRQIYGMRRRWIMALCTVLYTAFILAFIPLSALDEEEVRKMEKNRENTVTFGDAGTAGIPNPLVIVVVPYNSETKQLIAKAYHILERKYNNPMLFNVHVTFENNVERMKEALEESLWPTIGVQVHEMTRTKLEYTLRPVMTPYSLKFREQWGPPELSSISISSDQISHGLLQLRTALDAAYIQTYFPKSGHLQILSVPTFGEEDRKSSDFAKIDVINAGTYVSLSLLMLLSMLASYTVNDKLSGVRELLCVNGMPRWLVNIGWLVSFILLALIVALLQLVLVKYPHPLMKGISLPLLFIVLIVYGWTALTFVTFVANLFTSQLVAILLLLLYWILSTFVGTICVILLELLAKLYVAQGFISLLPNFGFIMFLTVLCEFSEVKTELSFGTLFSLPNKNISAGVVLIMMFIDILIFLALGLYLDAVKPGPFGRARPWHLLSRERANVVQPRVSENEIDAPSNRKVSKLKKRGGFFEDINYDEAGVGLDCVNIVKIFGTYKALNNVNVKVMKNKVTVLLGHNGAGKTTLFSILCGMISPTSGNVYTDEYSVFDGDNIHKFRRVLGYCPQENLVLNELSVQEHLIVFGMLKGLTKSEAREFSDHWTQMFGMYDKRHTQAKKLSGGTKRKLCLAIAMTGKPQYLLLDEPSAGMDIESTRKMWDVLLAEKGNCTVVITTHNMDEADILGDYIAILAHGQLKCFGSSSFLKKTLDSGYRLNCAAINKNTEVVINSVNRTIRGASVLYKTNRSVTFSLPSNQISQIPDLLRGLEKEFGESVSSALSLGTLDDVFIKVQKDEGVKINVEELPTVPNDEMRRSGWNFSDLFWRRVKWVLSKRMVTVIVIVILLPNLAMILGILSLYRLMKVDDVENSRFQRNAEEKSAVNFFDHQGMFALLSDHRDVVSDLVRSSLLKSGITFKETSEGMNTSLSEMAQKHAFEYRTKLLFAFDNQESDTPTAYLPSRTDDSVSMAYSTIVNALLRGNATIVTHNVPSKVKYFKDMIHCPIGYTPELPTLFFVLAGPFFLVATSYFVVFPHEERSTLFKHLQLMTGLLPAAYWLVNLAFDFLVYMCSCVLIVIIIACMDHMIDLLLEPTVLSAFVLSLLLYGLTSILLSYVASFFFRLYAITIVVLVLVNIMVSEVFAILSNLKKAPFESTFFLPWPILWNSIHKTLLWAIMKRDCDKCHVGCDDLKNTRLFAKQLKMEFICFVVLIIAYFLILMFLDHGLGKKLMGLIQRMVFGKIENTDQPVDPEVALEKTRVDGLKNADRDEYPELVCDGLGKKYSCKKTAVYDVTFTAERGECFGLVGVNGAGKTTTFGMLSALFSPTKGTATIEGRWKLTGFNYNYLKRVGYCPQYEGLLRELPARTIIRLFGRLGGVPKSQIGPLVDKWVNALDMDEIANRPCGHYSGGNKRKLSLAMALIGNPPVVLLDEPTAGVDPVVRRKIWEILTTSLEQNERTIILTSHTMSECEAICDRLTIMVEGVMKCLGPIPVLKKNFGKTSILEVKFTTNCTPKQRKAVQTKIESQFAGYIELHETQLARVDFLLNNSDVKMYDMFDTMLKIKAENAVVIDDFNMSEAPLEQIFLKFAQNKSVNTKNPAKSNPKNPAKSNPKNPAKSSPK